MLLLSCLDFNVFVLLVVVVPLDVVVLLAVVALYCAWTFLFWMYQLLLSVSLLPLKPLKLFSENVLSSLFLFSSSQVEFYNALN